MPKFMHAGHIDDDAGVDNDDAKAIAIPRFSPKTAELMKRV